MKEIIQIIEAICVAVASITGAASLCLPENRFTIPLWRIGMVAIAAGFLLMFAHRYMEDN